MWHRVFVLLDRLMVFAAAIFYVVSGIRAVVDSFSLLSGVTTPIVPYLLYHTDLMANAAGNATLNESPLVRNILGNNTTPRNDTLFLDTLATAGDYSSFKSCLTPSAVDHIYSDAFMRKMYTAFTTGMAYNVSYMSKIELIVPIVDCQSDTIRFHDQRFSKMFYLVRLISNHQKLFLISLSIVNQGYIVQNRDEKGSTALASVVLMNNMSATSLNRTFAMSLGAPWKPLDFHVGQSLGTTADRAIIMKIFPRNNQTETLETVLTACKSGFYSKSETDQSNVIHLDYRLSKNAWTLVAIRYWWGGSWLQDSWAWAHFIHVFLAINVILTVLVLLMISFHNVRAGRFWLGDSFVAISKSLVFRGVLVLLSWVFNKGWALMEFCLYDAARVSDVPDYVIKEEIMHADLMTVYISLVGVVGKLLHERIDPAMVVAVFQLSFMWRRSIIQWFPSLLRILQTTALEDFNAGTISAEDESISPMRLWNIHPIMNKRPSLIASVLFPIFFPMLGIIVYVIIRKIYRRWKHERVTITKQDGEVDGSPLLKHLRTQFELATGAQLVTHFGLVCDYKNYIQIKGLRYASPDGIYSNGFVVINSKFLVQMEDLPSIVLMKIFHVRFRSVFAFEVENFAVTDTAQLVYPETISFRDLLSINVSVLS